MQAIMRGKDTVMRILVVDDFEPWRHFVRLELQKQPTLQVVGETSDGLGAVRKAQELQPDLILLDIGLPKLNGIEAARRIRQSAPKTIILFVSENRLRDIAQEALATGASGYILKSEAKSELLAAIEAVLQGNQFVSASLRDHVDHTAFERTRRQSSSARLCNSDSGIEKSA
jgi:DNA-binding NarL/FixJ family response regulator